MLPYAIFFQIQHIVKPVIYQNKFGESFWVQLQPVQPDHIEAYPVVIKSRVATLPRRKGVTEQIYQTDTFQKYFHKILHLMIIH